MLFRLEDVATKLGISYTEARVLVLSNGAIPYFKIGARGIRIKEKDLKTYITEQQVKETPAETVDTREPFEGRQLSKREEDSGKQP